MSDSVYSFNHGRDFTFPRLQPNGKSSTASPLQELLRGVVSFVTTLVRCDSCFVYIAENGDLILRASKNSHPDVVDALKVKSGEGITGWVAQNRERVVLFERAYEDSRFRVFEKLPEDRFEAFLSVPIVCGDRLIGVINLQNRLPYCFSEREISLIAMAGHLIGAEIERVRLEAENAKLTDKLEDRKYIERAKGVLQRELNLSEEDAYRMLQRQSQERRRPMREIAEAVILGGEIKRPSQSSFAEAKTIDLPKSELSQSKI